MSKWIAEFDLEDGDTMPEHMDLEYKGAKIDFHCKPLEQDTVPFDFELYQAGLMDMPKEMIKVLDQIRAEIDEESTKSFGYPNWERAKALEWVLSIIDKYKAGSEK